MVPIVNPSETGAGNGEAPAERPNWGEEPAPSSPREEGHKLRADARRNRTQILRAAEAVFAGQGPGAPIDEVARRAGLGVGTVYRHFPTKEALFEAIVLERIRGLADEARRLWAAPDPGSALFCYLSRVFDQVMATKALAGALAGAGVDIDDKRRSPVWQGVWHDLREATQKLLARAQQAGEVRADVQLADLMGMVSGICHALLAEPSEGSCSAERMLAVVYDGLRASRGVGRPDTAQGA
jgi:AcrR family transcriptional regulator